MTRFPAKALAFIQNAQREHRIAKASRQLQRLLDRHKMTFKHQDYCKRRKAALKARA